MGTVSGLVLAGVEAAWRQHSHSDAAGLTAAVETLANEPRYLRVVSEAQFEPTLAERRSDTIRTLAGLLLSVGGYLTGQEPSR